MYKDKVQRRLLFVGFTFFQEHKMDGVARDALAAGVALLAYVLPCFRAF